MSAVVRQPLGPPSELFLRERGAADIAPLVSLRKGQEIGRQGERCSHLYVVAHGQIVLTRRNEEGEPHTLCILGPNELLGEDSLVPGQVWQVNARALTAAGVHALPASQLPRFFQYFPKMTANLLALLAGRVQNEIQRKELLLSDCARERVLGFFRLMARREAQAGEYAPVGIRLTQSQIAEMLGLARETVVRTMADLERDGLVQRDPERRLWVRSHLLGSFFGAILLLRVLTGPLAAACLDPDTDPTPYLRGRRGRIMKAPIRPCFSMGAVGPHP